MYGVGKIQDIFARQGLTEALYSDSNDHGVDLTLEYLRRPGPALVFSNLVDFDSKYGHRNDPPGYAHAVEALDRRMPELVGALGRRRAAAHRRPRVRPDDALDGSLPRAHPDARCRARRAVRTTSATRDTFADLGATAAELLGVGTSGEPRGVGWSFGRGELRPVGT